MPRNAGGYRVYRVAAADCALVERLGYAPFGSAAPVTVEL